MLWIFSAAGGWGGDAFCTADRACLDDYRRAVELSVALAVPAGIFGVLGWLLLRDHPQELDTLLLLTAALWIAAGAILFIGGYLLT
ncbi:hypothetical protein GCM10010468_48330 [Actinocorallia longicatena]|uniref:Uncharacterized protein n=1 Tax=Actinocorallia longicatena TaxID=111803 RepID=A0ABP6QFF5_9ACTN